MAIQEGEPAPPFALRGAGGATAPWCSACRPTTGESHRRFSEKYDLPFTLLTDPDKKTMTAYGAWGEKVLYGRATVGVIRSTVWIAPDGTVRKHWVRVSSAAQHPERVLEAVRKRGES